MNTGRHLPVNDTARSPLLELLPSDNFLHVIGRKFWTIRDVDEHLGRFERALDAFRQSHGTATVMIDLRESPVQSAAVAERFGQWNSRLYLPHDRVAIILASSLLKSQVRRVPIAATRELFLSPTAALTWLMADLTGQLISEAA